MNKTAATGCCVLVLSACPALAQSSVTLSGIVDAAARYTNNEGVGSISSLISGGNSTSRFIFRGVEDLGGGLSASFHLESGIALDTGTSTASISSSAAGIFDRRSTVSLASKTLGEVRLGRDYVPTYNAWVKHDPFSHVGVAGSGNFTSAGQVGPIRSAFGTGANTTQRANNAVGYFLPGGLGGFTGQVMVAAGEGGVVAEGGTKAIGVLLGWDGGSFSVTGAHTRSENQFTANGEFQDSVLGGTMAFGPARINLAWREYKQADSKQTNIILSTLINVGSGDFKASYVKADMSGRVGATVIDGNGAQQFGVGYVYNLSKRTALYGTVSFVENESASTFVVPGGPGGIAGGKSSNGFDFGMRHSF